MSDLRDVVSMVADAQAAYVRCIDSDCLEDWPAFFHEPCLYKVTSVDNHREGFEAGLIFANTLGMLRDRVSALREANIYEHQAYRHILGRPFLLSQVGDEAQTETPFLVVRIMRDGTTELFASGRYLDRFVIAADAAQLHDRVVVCDSSRIDTLLAIPL